jgi:hypothetical protein
LVMLLEPGMRAIARRAAVVTRWLLGVPGGRPPR